MTNFVAALVQVALVDIVLAGDNAVIVGALAAHLPDQQRRVALVGGTLGAMGARIAFSLIAVWLLMIPGLKIVGGLALFWVAWKMWRSMRSEEGVAPVKQVGFMAAIGAIITADISMSLDNVLGVAGAADGHMVAMALGLVLSVALMGVGASMIAALIKRYPPIAYVGLCLVILVAVRMVGTGFGL